VLELVETAGCSVESKVEIVSVVVDLNPGGPGKNGRPSEIEDVRVQIDKPMTCVGRGR
jgi:hypothetical protein